MADYGSGKAWSMWPSCHQGWILQGPLKWTRGATPKPSFKNHNFKNFVLFSPEIENLGQISPGRVQTSKKYIDYSPACVTDSESSTLSFCNGKAHIQFNFMHFRDGSV